MSAAVVTPICGDTYEPFPDRVFRCTRSVGHEGDHGYAGVFWPVDRSNHTRKTYDDGVLDTVKRFEVLADQITEFAALFIPPADTAIRNAAVTIRNLAKQIRSGEVES